MRTKEKRKIEARAKKRRRIQSIIRGTQERPRLSVFRSLRNIYAQIIDDEGGRTLVAASSQSSGLVPEEKPGGKTAIAKLVGTRIAETARERGIEKVVFDRGVYRYHGRVKALADAARAAGLQF